MDVCLSLSLSIYINENLKWHESLHNTGCDNFSDYLTLNAYKAIGEL